MKKLSSILLCSMLAAMLLISGCIAPMSETPREESWTLSELENRIAGPDPIEPFNRVMFGIQHFFMEYPLDYLAIFYTSLLPKPVIKAVNNVCLNLEFPARLFSTLLRAEWRGAGDECLRFLANSTLGIAGLFDVGQHWFGLHSTSSDFGQTFHTWGIDPGCTFIFPGLPRTNIRDGVGYIFDSALDLKTWIPYSSAVMINQIVVAHSQYYQAFSGSLDPYKEYRQTQTLLRKLHRRMWFHRVSRRPELFIPQKLAAPPLPAPQGLQGKWHDLPVFGTASPVNSTLRSVLWQPEQRNTFWYMPRSLFTGDFSGKMKKLKVELPGDRKVICGFWPAPVKIDYSDPSTVQPAPKLAVILPGIGGAFNGGSTMALAEMFRKDNFAVLTFDSPFSGSFLEQSRSGKLPGHIDFDAGIITGVLEAALDMLDEEGLTDLPEITLAGYSFGALHTLKIALNDREKDELGIRRFIALCPPVSLKNAAEQADLYAAAGKNWSEKETFDRLTEVAGRFFITFQQKFPPAAAGMLPLFQPEQEEARFLAGLYFRLPLRNILLEGCRSGKIKLKTPYDRWRRNKLYLEIDRIGFREYAGKFVAPQFPGLTLDELYHRNDLRSAADKLKKLDRVKILHTWDDPLLTPDDRRFLDRCFGSNITWFSRGGHLGNFYLPEVKKVIMDSVNTPR